MSRVTVRVATRGSQLAVTQTKQTIQNLQEVAPEASFELVIIKTGGDKDGKTNLTSFGGVGIFVKELEEALLDGRADIAIHSLKDVPSIIPKQLTLASFPKRAEVNDVWISKKYTWPEVLNINPKGGKIVVGTGSPRRRLQLETAAPGIFEFREIRGNIDTRLTKLDTGEYDAVILAAAGLARLGVRPKYATNIDLAHCLPAVGQGSLAIEARAQDSTVIDLVRRINHEPTELAVKAERSFMTVLEGGCRLPLACYAHSVGDRVQLLTSAGDAEAGQEVKLSLTCTADLKAAVAAGGQLAQTMRHLLNARSIAMPGTS